ncbi:MAG: hypothetical protein KJN63_05840, partial [Acidimicrobiia bacterium]|nr:hypothetical protein [Acidimicrobiia bacterium]
DDGDPPTLVSVGSDEELLAAVVEAVRTELKLDEAGNAAVIVPLSMADDVEAALGEAGLEAGRAPQDNLDSDVTIVPVRLVKGLEVDASIVVSPERIVVENPQGFRSLYVALTRSTQRMTIIGHVDHTFSDLAARLGY